MNLLDLSAAVSEDPGGLEGYFDILPMAVVEAGGGKYRFARSNQSFRDFMLKYFGFDLNDDPEPFFNRKNTLSSPFMEILRRAETESGTLYADGSLLSGISVHACIRRIAVNRVTGIYAAVVAVLSISSGDFSTIYANIAKALSADYFSLYYVDLNTEQYYEYTTLADKNSIDMQRNGGDFFASSRKEALNDLHHDDAERFIEAFTKENVTKQLDEYGVFTLDYRMMINGEPVNVSMKTIRMQDDPSHIIIGVSNVDSQVKQKQMIEKINRDKLIYSSIIALSGDYYSIYSADPVTNEYYEYSYKDAYIGYGLPQQGDDIFISGREHCMEVIYEPDREDFLKQFTKENVIAHIRQSGHFSIHYRLVYNGRLVPVTLKATLVKEQQSERLLIGICRREETD